MVSEAGPVQSVRRVLLDLESDEQVPSQLFNLIAMGPWVSQETSLSLSFIICKVGLVIILM